MNKIIEKIKEIFKESPFNFKGIAVSEQIALLSTILASVFLIITVFLIINFILPKANVDIKILGPKEAIAGEEVTYTVIVKNTGNVVLKKPELIFHFPSSSVPETSLIQPVLIEKDLFPKEEKSFEFKAQLFGQEESKLEAKAWLNYSKKEKGRTIMSKTVGLTTLISEVPIDLVVDIPQRIAIAPGKKSDFAFRVRCFSLIEEAIPNLKLLITLPRELTVEETIPLKEKEYWEVPLLEGFKKEEVDIIGSFSKQQKTEAELDFNVQLFISLHGTDVLLIEQSIRSVTFKPDFLVTQIINTKENHSPYPGEILHYEIYFKNIEEKPFSDLNLSVVLEGNLYNLDTIEAPDALFQKGSHSITWTGKTVPELRYLTSGEEGKVDFWIHLQEDYRPENLTEINASIKNKVVLGGFEKEFRNRVSSRVKVSQEVYFKDKYGFFENSGHQPPIVNKTSYYTVVWKIENYYNQIKDVEVKARLPERVLFRGVKSPVGEIKVKTDPFEIESPYYPVIPKTFKFQNPLSRNMRSEEVRYLQIILKKEVPHAYPERVPATGLFGPITFEAVKAFQLKHEKDILITPQGADMPTGYVDLKTRTKLNQLLLEGMPSGFSEVAWQIKNIKPGVGVFEEPLIAAFQIAFTPEMAQKNKIATLINEITLSAKDEWTEIILFSADGLVDTNLPDDSSVRSGQIR